MLQIAVLSNHLNGRDTHVRQIKVYGPRPYVSLYFLINFLETVTLYQFFHVKPYCRNPIPQQPFQFTSEEFITYSTIR